MFDSARFFSDLGVATDDFQDSICQSSSRFILNRAARRTGKSLVAAKWAVAKERGILTPGTRGWIVGPTYDLAEKEFRYVVEILEKAHKKLGLPRPIMLHHNAKMGDLYIKMPWGAEVIGKSAERPLSLVGEELDWIIMSEAAQQKADTWFRYLRPTLSSRMGSAIFPTTPDISGAWLYELELKMSTMNEDVGRDEWALFHRAAWDTPHYNKEEIESARRELSEDAFSEQFGGEWTFHEGRVFKAYSPLVHLVDPFPLPAGWKYWSGVDFGHRDATAVVWAAQSGAGDFYIINEYYQTSRPTEVHTSVVKSRDRTLPYLIRVSDHHALGKQLAHDWRVHGVPTLDASVDRKSRRDRLMAILEPRDYHAPYHVQQRGGGVAKYPRLYIFKGKCPNLVREIQLLKWKEGTRQEGTYGDTVGDDHAVDALEYMIYYATRGRKYRQPASAYATQQPRRPVSALTGY